MKKNQLYINTLNTNVRRLASGWICTNFTLCFTNISYTCILPHRSMAFGRLKDKVKFITHKEIIMLCSAHSALVGLEPTA